MTCLELLGRDTRMARWAKTVGDRALLCHKATKLLLMAVVWFEVEAKRGADRSRGGGERGFLTFFQRGFRGGKWLMMEFISRTVPKLG